MPLLGERGGGKDPPRLKIETDANNNNNNNNDNNNNNNNNRGLSTTVVFNHRTKNPITGGGGICLPFGVVFVAWTQAKTTWILYKRKKKEEANVREREVRRVSPAAIGLKTIASRVM